MAFQFNTNLFAAGQPQQPESVSSAMRKAQSETLDLRRKQDITNKEREADAFLTQAAQSSVGPDGKFDYDALVSKVAPKYPQKALELKQVWEQTRSAALNNRQAELKEASDMADKSMALLGGIDVDAPDAAQQYERLWPSLQGLPDNIKSLLGPKYDPSVAGNIKTLRQSLVPVASQIRERQERIAKLVSGDTQRGIAAGLRGAQSQESLNELLAFYDELGYGKEARNVYGGNTWSEENTKRMAKMSMTASENQAADNDAERTELARKTFEANQKAADRAYELDKKRFDIEKQRIAAEQGSASARRYEAALDTYQKTIDEINKGTRGKTVNLQDRIVYVGGEITPEDAFDMRQRAKDRLYMELGKSPERLPEEENPLPQAVRMWIEDVVSKSQGNSAGHAAANDYIKQEFARVAKSLPGANISSAQRYVDQLFGKPFVPSYSDLSNSSDSPTRLSKNKTPAELQAERQNKAAADLARKNFKPFAAIGDVLELPNGTKGKVVGYEPSGQLKIELQK